MDKNRQLEFSDERENIKETLADIGNQRNPVSLVLDGLRGHRNIGLMFRLADAARIKKIYLHQCNIELPHKLVSKISRRTVRYVPYEVLKDEQDILRLKENSQLVALEITSKSIPFINFKPTQKEVTLVIGGEKDGVSNTFLELVDESIHIPMMGVNTSMNVSCAAAIGVYEILGKMGVLW